MTEATQARQNEILLTAGQAAEFLGISANALNRYSRTGQIPFVQYGPTGWRRYLVRDLAAFLESSRKGGDRNGHRA